MEVARGEVWWADLADPVASSPGGTHPVLIVQANALLEEDLQDPGQKRLAQMVQQNADRLARIAEEVLDIARVQHQISHAPGATLALDASVAQVWSDWSSQDPARRQGTSRP